MRVANATALTALVLGGLFSLAQAAPAQSLAEIAQKQKENRKGKQKVYTEEDLKKGGTRGFTPAEGSAGGAEGEAPATSSTGEGGAAPAGPPKSDDELKAERETAWREKLVKARDNVTQLTGEVSRIEAALGDLTVSVYGAARANRLAALDKTKQQLTAGQQTVADLEEEGRRNGFR